MNARFVVLLAAALATMACGDLNRDVIVPNHGGGDAGAADATPPPASTEDASLPSPPRTPSPTCPEDGGCAPAPHCYPYECTPECRLGCDPGIPGGSVTGAHMRTRRRPPTHATSP